MKIGIVGAGAMGSGIAQVVATVGHVVVITDTNAAALDKSKMSLASTLSRLIDKGKMTSEKADAITSRIHYATAINELSDCGLVIEAVVENADVKKNIFDALEKNVVASCILASNTSSLSITAIAGQCHHPERVMGIHFFNPAPLMPLVEIIPALQSDREKINEVKLLVQSWGKTPVIAKDTPGFIVNRVARPFYGEALRILEEGIATKEEIDHAMTVVGQFKMGPFELMDLIGNDVNYAVTESVFQAMYFDPRYKPSITQKKMVEAGWLGRKSGRGYYDYSKEKTAEPAAMDTHKSEEICNRILAMLINEAYEALYLGIASREDLDLAMTKGVNYPKGLLSWSEEIGIKTCVERIDRLYELYREDRYRCSPLMRKLAS